MFSILLFTAAAQATTAQCTFESRTSNTVRGYSPPETDGTITNFLGI